MKRLMPQSLIDFKLANKNCQVADLFAVTNLRNGQAFYTTSGWGDITLTEYVASPESGTPGWTGSTTTFYATKYGRWKRGVITSEAGFDLKSNSMELTCEISDPLTAFPGLALGMLGGAFNGMFDRAQVAVYTAYFNTYGDTSAGIETQFSNGFIDSNKEIDRNHVVFEVQDFLYLCDQKIPARIVQAGCQWSFCDSNCTLSASDFTVTFTAANSSTTTTLTPQTAFTQAAGYFSQGVVTCTSGGNQGLKQTVKLHDSSGNLQMTIPWLVPITDTDTFSVIKGCDKSSSMCGAQIKANGDAVNNLVHFSGAPSVPQPLTAL